MHTGASSVLSCQEIVGMPTFRDRPEKSRYLISGTGSVPGIKHARNCFRFQACNNDFLLLKIWFR